MRCRFRRRRCAQAFGLTDVCVLLFLVGVIALTGVRAVRAANDGNSRTKCASNLRQIGQAIQIYANENKGAFPRTVFDLATNPVPTEYTSASAPDPFAPGGPGPNDVTAPLFLLLRATAIAPESFVCPSSGAVAFAGNVTAKSNFVDRSNLTYAYTNPYPSAAARQLGYKLNFTLNSDFAIAADMGRGPDVGLVAANAARKRMMRANSPFHRGEGQNVLYADGHVDWSPTIFSGAARPIPGAPKDNVYAYGVDASMAAPSTGIVGAPQDQHDSVILPTADMGPQSGPLPAPGSVGRTNQQILVGVGVAIMIGMALVIVGVVIRAKPRDGYRPRPPA